MGYGHFLLAFGGNYLKRRFVNPSYGPPNSLSPGGRGLGRGGIFILPAIKNRPHILPMGLDKSNTCLKLTKL